MVPSSNAYFLLFRRVREFSTALQLCKLSVLALKSSFSGSSIKQTSRFIQPYFLRVRNTYVLFETSCNMPCYTNVLSCSRDKSTKIPVSRLCVLLVCLEAGRGNVSTDCSCETDSQMLQIFRALL